MKANAELVRLPQLTTASTLTWREGDSFQSGDYRYLLDCSNDELDAQMRKCERTLASTRNEYLCIQHLVNGSIVFAHSCCAYGYRMTSMELRVDSGVCGFGLKCSPNELSYIRTYTMYVHSSTSIHLLRFATEVHRRREVPNLEIFDTNIALQIRAVLIDGNFSPSSGSST